MKIWSKDDREHPELIGRFTVGRDREFDILLAKYDVQGSLAHVQMLQSVGLLNDADHLAVSDGLKQIAKEVEEGSFEISDEAEDVHSQIEWLLTKRIGEAGKKIHTGRSRNDQVAVDIKLYLKDEVLKIKESVVALFELLMSLSNAHKDILIPGYTHLQVAMPSSIGMWLGAYAECLVDDLEMLAAAYAIVNKNPLGSGAGYGTSFPLDRDLTTRLLGFNTMHYNSVAAQMSRGRTEKVLAMALSCIASTISKLAMDICLYVSQNFGFISFPESLTTGSSIMPHKKNPDIFELVRGKCNRIQSVPNELSLLMTNLPSGYHRDLQLTKEVLFPAIQSLKDCIEVMLFSIPQMHVRDGILNDERYKYVFTVDAVNDLVKQGRSFREAYIEVGKAVESATFQPGAFNAASYTHEGSIGNLCNSEISILMTGVCKKFEK